MKIAIPILIIGLVIAAGGLGAYATTPPAKGKLVLDWWYESSGHYPQSADQAAVYKAQLERTGLITVNLHSVDWATYRKQRNAQTMPIYVLGWFPDYLDPDDYTFPFLNSKAQDALLRDNYTNPSMDSALAQARSTADPNARGQAYSQVQDLLRKDAPIIPVFQGSQFAVTKPTVSGVVMDITQNMYYWLITPPPGKDTLVVGTTDSVQVNLDPAEAYDYFGDNSIYNLGAPLVYVKPGSGAGPNDFIPGLATKWTPSADGLTWTFDLRQGLKFADGSNFTAAAVKYSFDRSIGIAADDGSQVALGYSDMIASVSAPSPYQVVFKLKQQVPWFLSLMAFAGSFIVNPKYATQTKLVQYADKDPRASNPNDLGPYLLGSWTRQAGKDVEMRLDANPNYFGVADGYPKAKHVIFKFYSDATALALAIKSGDVDMAYRSLSPTDIKALQSDQTVKVWTGTGAFIQYIVFVEKYKPLDNPQIRQAIGAAINRKELVNTVFLNQASPLYSMIPNGMAFHKDVFNDLEDPNMAATTLRSLGYSETTTNPLAQTYLAVGVVGLVIAVVGALMFRRKKA